MTRKERKIVKQHDESTNYGIYLYDSIKSQLRFSPDDIKWDMLKILSINKCNQTFPIDDFNKNNKQKIENCKEMINDILEKKMLPYVYATSAQEEKNYDVAVVIHDVAVDINETPLLSITDYAINKCNKYDEKKINSCRNGVIDAYNNDNDNNYNFKLEVFTGRQMIELKDIGKKFFQTISYTRSPDDQKLFKFPH